MKKITLISGLCVMLCSCSKNPQKKAERLVKSYLDSALNDPKSYESIEFLPLDTIHQTYEASTIDGKKLDSLRWMYADSARYFEGRTSVTDDYGTVRRANFTKSAYYLRKQQQVESEIIDKNKTYSGPISGYYLYHQYRAKNGFGALTIYATKFRLDSAITTIVNTEDISN